MILFLIILWVSWSKNSNNNRYEFQFELSVYFLEIYNFNYNGRTFCTYGNIFLYYIYIIIKLLLQQSIVLGPVWIQYEVLINKVPLFVFSILTNLSKALGFSETLSLMDGSCHRRLAFKWVSKAKGGSTNLQYTLLTPPILQELASLWCFCHY